MADKVIDRFFIALGLDTKDVEKGINDTVTTVKGGLKNLLVGAVMPALGALATGELVQQFTAEITQVDRLSKSLGVNIEQLQAWQGAAENAGVAGEEIGEIFADLNDWMIDSAVNGSGALNDFIEKGMLPAVKDANGAMKSTEQYAMDLADAFAAMDKQSATGIGRQIGISNAGMVAFLQQGSASISAQMQQIKQLGVYTEEDAKAAREFDKSLKSLFRSLKMMLLPVFRIVAPVATLIAQGLQKISQHAVALIPVLAGVAAMLSTVLFPAIMQNVKAALTFIASPWGILLAALTAIGLLLDDFVTWLEGGESAFGEFYESVFGNAENVKNAINDFVDNAKAAFDDFKTTAISIWTAVEPYVTAFGNMLLSLGRLAWDWAGTIAAAVNVVYEVFRGLITGGEDMQSRVGEALDALQNKFNDVLADIKSYFASWWEFVSPIIDKITGFFDMELPSLPSFSLFEGNPALSTPGTAGTTNNTSNHETNIDGKVNITIQGNADREAMQQAQGDSSQWFSGLTAQGNASQYGI